ncbi:hypothetical protein NC652_014212 [Populus alba x Populus x berolinensis]|nr:hypothetical protein NC652_014212 [Populus alba x Populus x berolinensis]
MSPAFEQVAIVLSLRGDQPSWVFPRKFLPVQWIFATLLQLASCSNMSLGVHLENDSF